jgi:hypothetical protein
MFVHLLRYELMAAKAREAHSMSETKRYPELLETSLAYVLSAVAALLGFLLIWLICTVVGFYRG